MLHLSWLNFNQATELCLWPQYHPHGRVISLGTFCACHPTSGRTDVSCGTDRSGGALLSIQDAKPPPTTLPWRTDHSSEKVKADSRVRGSRERRKGKKMTNRVNEEDDDSDSR